jgi:HTH-type transcriptional regulator/antitoxin HipB
MHLARDPKQLGNAIRTARKRKGWSQGELAKRAGLRQGTISMAETGFAATKIQTLLAILSTLELEMQISPRSSQNTERVE